MSLRLSYFYEYITLGVESIMAYWRIQVTRDLGSLGSDCLVILTTLMVTLFILLLVADNDKVGYTELPTSSSMDP